MEAVAMAKISDSRKKNIYTRERNRDSEIETARVSGKKSGVLCMQQAELNRNKQRL